MSEETKNLIVRYTAGAHSRINNGSNIGQRILVIHKLIKDKYEEYANDELIGIFLGLNVAITIVQATKTNHPEDGGIVFNTRDANFAAGETLDYVNRSLSVDIFVVCLIIESRRIIV